MITSSSSVSNRGHGVRWIIIEHFEPLNPLKFMVKLLVLASTRVSVGIVKIHKIIR